MNRPELGNHIGKTLCSLGFHKWRIHHNLDYNEPTKWCARCGKWKNGIMPIDYGKDFDD